MPQHADISTRHFPPELSDASFQIPSLQDDMLTENKDGDFELVYDAFDDSELGGLDADPFTTPIPRSRHLEPLTLSEITPRGQPTNHCTPVNGGPNGRPAEGAAQNQKGSTEQHVLPKEPVDDMFERRKRDNYQQKGIDLTSKSTARLRRTPDEILGKENAHTEFMARTKPFATGQVVSSPFAARSRTTEGSKVKTKRSVVEERGGVVKYKHRVPSSKQPKSILKASKPTAALPSSTLSRTMTVLSQTSKAERPKWGDVVAEVQHASQGRESRGSGIGIMEGGLIDMLVMYGEKLKNSFGLSSSGNSSTRISNAAEAAEESRHTTRVSIEDSPFHPHDRASASSKPLTLSDLTPSKSRDARGEESLTPSELSPSRQPWAPSEISEQAGVDKRSSGETSPTRPSKKRVITRSPRIERKKGKVDSVHTSGRPESSKAASKSAKHIGKVTSKPRALGPSQAVNGVHKSVESTLPGAQASSMGSISNSTKFRLATISSRDLPGKGSETTGIKAESKRNADKKQHPPSLTIPSGPLFVSDVYRQRALEKTQAEREKRDEQERQKRSFKAGAMPCFRKPAPPARPAVRTTVPVAFTFQSDMRAAHRNAEFEEKQKMWETRTTRQALPMPDFAAIHAARAGTLRTKRAVPVLPTDAPPLTTMIRAKEREKFEEDRRARERAAEKLRETRQREREEQEEREYREARKRTVPKAHDVPEWYKDVPRRKEVE